MFCPNCGKPIKENDNFCRYCGSDLRVEETAEEQCIIHHYEQQDSDCNEILPPDDSEELVLSDIKKHWMALFWPLFMTPVFFVYFWLIFLNTHSFFSWVIVFLILIPIVYPILRYNSDKIVVTTKFVHIKIGVLNPAEVDIPLSKLDILELSQTMMGRIGNYGSISFVFNGEQYEYDYIANIGELQFLIDNPAKYIEEMLEE